MQAGGVDVGGLASWRGVLAGACGIRVLVPGTGNVLLGMF